MSSVASALSALPIRLRLAAGFAVGLVVVLALAGWFVYVRVGSDLDAALASNLEARVDELSAVIENAGFDQVDLGDVRIGEEQTTFSQIINGSGGVIDSSPSDIPSLLSGPELDAARSRSIAMFDLKVAEIEGISRAIATPVLTPDGIVIALVGTSESDRQETLDGIRNAFLVGGPIALLLATLIGYGLGGRALRPVEEMGDRARRLTFDQGGERLPVPGADDELRHLALILNEMLDRVDGALDRERTFVADASHELRTPLAILRSEIELVQRTGGDRATLKAALDSAGDEVEHLVALAEDLLVIARAQDGRLPINREPTAIGALLEAIGRRFAKQSERQERRIVVRADRIGSRLVDPLRLEQAIGNLVDNALRHGGGEVAIEARAVGERLELTVRDDGPGFDPGFAAAAFERFSRADQGRADGGAGLGLALVRAIARAHRGEVTITADRSPGAAVVLDLLAPPRRQAL